MDVNGNNVDQRQVKYCTHCGTKNFINDNFCANCGVSMSTNTAKTVQNQGDQIYQNNQVSQNNQTNKKDSSKAPSKLLLIFAGVIVIFACLYVPNLSYIVIVAAIASLFFKKTRTLGVTILSGFGAMFFLMFMFVLFVFGACFLAIGAAGL